LLLFSVLYGFWVANYAASNGQVMRELAARFLNLAERQGATAPLMVGHRLMATSLFHTGEIAEGRAHFDSAIAHYDIAEHRSLATLFGQDVGVVILSWRAVVLWLLGYPAAALADVDAALENAREAQQATTLMYAQVVTSFTLIHCGNYTRADAQTDEVVATADEKGTLFWKAQATVYQGFVSVLTGKASDAIQTINAGIIAWRSTGASLYAPLWLSYLAKGYAELGQFDDAWRCIGEAMSAVATTEERWCEPEVYRTAGEIASLSSQLDAAKAEGYFQRALTIARQQKAKSWELRAAMSLARLWRDQGKPQQARELLAPVYGWFTEGFDTRDLKEAKALLEQLS
jgi:predicted ATPase